MLRLRHGHSVAGNDDHGASLFQNLRRAFDGFFLVGPLFTASRSGLHLAERAEQHIHERTVHRPAHDDRQNQTARAIQRAGRDEQIVSQHKPHRHGRQPGVGIQNRNHGRHVGTADRNDQQHAKRQRHQHDQMKGQTADKSVRMKRPRTSPATPPTSNRPTLLRF